MLPDRLDGFLKLLNREIRRCKNPIRIAFLKNLGDQVEKYPDCNGFGGAPKGRDIQAQGETLGS